MPENDTPKREFGKMTPQKETKDARWETNYQKRVWEKKKRVWKRKRKFGKRESYPLYLYIYRLTKSSF